MCAMDSLIRSCVLVLLVTGISGRSLLSEIETSNSTDDYLTEDLQIESDCNWRYYQHYHIKGCQVNQVDARGCPISYSCPSKANASFAESKVCVYKNVEYQVGDKIELNDKCKVCRCAGGDDLRITCRQRECPQMEPVDGRNCHLVYEENNCCPSRYECASYSDGINNLETTEFSCIYRDIQYPLGSKIYPSEDVCLVCECTKDWTGVGNSSCHQQDCVIEKNKHKLESGCIPVYHENKCCPVEYYCPENLENSYSIFEESEISKEETTVNDSQCTFGGTLHPIGTDIPMNNPCIKCSCRVPPDFTCIHQSCPPPPAADCFWDSVVGHCCPLYECLLGDDGRTTNDSSEAICPTPLCADKSCVIGNLPGHECPTCICDDSREKNDLEPLYEEHEPNYIETKNETDALDNEIISPLIPESFREREPLSEVLGEDSNPETALEHEEKEGQDTTTELEPLPMAEESTTGEREFEGEFEETTPQVEMIHSTASFNEVRQKRSGNFESAAIDSSNSQQQWNIYQQQDQFVEDPEDSNSNSERELEGNGENVDEIKVLSTKNSARRTLDELVELEENELENVIWTTEVAGCPAPMCADSSCRVGIPPGLSCPTCVCKKRRNRQP